MSNPKIKPCPRCHSDERIAVYAYESGWRHVECDGCYYLGPGEGSIRQAIITYNAVVAAVPPSAVPSTSSTSEGGE